MVCERIQLMQILNLVILNYGYTVMSGFEFEFDIGLRLIELLVSKVYFKCA